MTAILRRELRASFTSPSGYVFLSVFLLVANLLFIFFNLALSSSDLSSLFYSMAVLFMFLTPLLSMRMLAGEYRAGTDKLLLCAPVRPFSIVMGKFLAGLSVCAAALALSLGDVAVVALSGRLNAASAAGNYAGLLFLAALFVSAGLFISSLCESQFVAAAGSLCIFSSLFVLDWAADFIPWRGAAAIMLWISPLRRFSNMTRGMFFFSDIIFFLSAAFIFLFLASRVLEKRRWSKGGRT